MISMAAIKPLPIWNALRRSYLNPLFLLRPIVSLPALSQHTVVRSMVVGEKPVNRFCSSGVEKDAVHSPSEKRSSRKLGFRFLEFSETELPVSGVLGNSAIYLLSFYRLTYCPYYREQSL